MRMGAALSAARLSGELALAALAAAGAGALYMWLQFVLGRAYGPGSWTFAALLDADYVAREPVILWADPDSVARRSREINQALLLSELLMVCAFPLAYMQYLGCRSWRVCAGTAATIALSIAVLEIGYVVLNVYAMSAFIGLLSLLVLYATLRVLCPKDSAVPRQALRQMLIVCIGSVIVRYAPDVSSVRCAVAIYCMERAGLSRLPPH